MSPSEALRREIRSRCDAIEEAYEFMLAYAAQGLTDHRASSAGAPISNFLRKADTAMAGLAGVFRALIHDEPLSAAPHYLAFVDLLAQDAQKARTALQVVLAQEAISSQLVDNLNASIHLRALLTDIFLIDEVLKASGAVESQ